MARHRGPVLVDTNVILECWRVSAWRALSSGYRVETVEECVIETQTGFQRRRREQQIDQASLQQSLAAVHRPGPKEFAVLAVQAPDIVLDLGERALWAHALTRNDDWLLCGPDKASLRCGVRLGFRERLVAAGNIARCGRPSTEGTLAIQLHDRVACAGAERDRADGGTETPMTAPVRSLDVRSSIVTPFAVTSSVPGRRMPISQGSG